MVWGKCQEFGQLHNLAIVKKVGRIESELGIKYSRM